MKCLENKWDGYYQKLIEYCERFDLNDKEVQVDEYGNIAVLKSDRWWRMNSFIIVSMQRVWLYRKL